eukprot:jgi/Hompol1/724/HPOL_005396-RA
MLAQLGRSSASAILTFHIILIILISAFTSTFSTTPAGHCVAFESRQRPAGWFGSSQMNKGFPNRSIVAVGTKINPMTATNDGSKAASSAAVVPAVKAAGDNSKEEDTIDTNWRWLGYASRLRNFVAVRHFAYTSDVGEAFRPVVPVALVNLSYAISFAYVGADVIYEGLMSHKRGDNQTEITRTVVQRSVFQGLASLLLPAITIHSVVHFAEGQLKNASSRVLRMWGPTAAGLMVIPALPIVLDHPIEWAMDKAFDTFWPLSEDARRRAALHGHHQHHSNEHSQASKEK